MKTSSLFWLGVLLLAHSELAMAYVGPGLGAGTVAAVLGVVVGLLMLVVGAIWYPIKRLIRKFWPRQ